MAIITLSPIIHSMSGRDGDMVHYRRGNTNCARAYVEQDDPNTDLQRSSRSMFSMAVRSWQVLPAGEKSVYAKRAVNLNMSGYNFYISEYMKARRDARSCVSTEFANNTTYRYDRFGVASASLLLRFSFASASISPLTCRLPGPEIAFPIENRGIFPP